MRTGYRLSLTSQPFLPRLSLTAPLSGELGSLINSSTSKESISINTFECDVATDRMMHEHMTRPLFANGRVTKSKGKSKAKLTEKETEKKFPTPREKKSPIKEKDQFPIERRTRGKRGSRVEQRGNPPFSPSVLSISQQDAAALGVAAALIQQHSQQDTHEIEEYSEEETRHSLSKRSLSAPSNSDNTESPIVRASSLNVPWNRSQQNLNLSEKNNSTFPLLTAHSLFCLSLASLRFRHSLQAAQKDLTKSSSPEFKTRTLYDQQLNLLNKERNLSNEETDRKETEYQNEEKETLKYTTETNNESKISSLRQNFPADNNHSAAPVAAAIAPTIDRFTVAKKYVRNRQWGIDPEFGQLSPPEEGEEITSRTILPYAKKQSSIFAQNLSNRNSVIIHSPNLPIRRSRSSRSRSRNSGSRDESEEEEESQSTLSSKSNSVLGLTPTRHREISHTISATGQLRRSSINLLTQLHNGSFCQPAEEGDMDSG